MPFLSEKAVASAMTVVLPVVVALLQHWSAVKIFIVCLTPSRIDLFHLNHGVFDCTIERRYRVAIVMGDRECPGGREDFAAGEHELISLLLGGDDCLRGRS